MHKYRQIIYESYRSNVYSLSNDDNVKNKIARFENYEAEFLRYLPKNKHAKILDLGCGSGFFVEYLLSKGYVNVVGIDVSCEQVEYAISKNLPVLLADANQFLCNNGDYDFIFFTDVIEHLKKEEILDFLFNIKKSLASGGLVVLRTGNASSIYGATIRYIDFTHEIAFTENSLRQILLATGFVNVDINDSKPKFGFKPTRLLRWVIFKFWRLFLKLIYLVEVGTDSPRLFGKLLIASARKS